MWLCLGVFILPTYASSVPGTQLEHLGLLRSNIDLILDNEYLCALTNTENPGTEPSAKDIDELKRIMDDLRTARDMLNEDAESMNKQEMLGSSRQAMVKLQNFLAINFEKELFDGLGDIRGQIEGSLELYNSLLNRP